VPSTEGHPADPRIVDDSRAVLTTPVLPADTNAYGNIFGGALVALIDKVASITAFRHARRNVVTASIDALDFHEPVRLGDILTLRSWLNYVGRSSMEIEVDVTTEDKLSGASHRACSAFLTFVAVDETGRPTPVPRLRLQGEEQESRFEAGAERCRQRRQSK
jgi:acyl-CoA hydrolase